MDYSFLTLVFLLSVLLKWFLRRKGRFSNNLPPAPPALPIIGHLHLVRKPFHRSLSELSRRYGPVILLRLGSRPVLVVSSPSAAEECFTRNDVIFANRPTLLSTKYLHDNNTTMAVVPYGPHWSNLRRLTSLHALSSSSVSSSAWVREEELKALLRRLLRKTGSGRCRESFGRVEVRNELTETAFNVLMRTISGKRCNAEERKLLLQFGEEILLPLLNWTALEDFLPVLGWFRMGKNQYVGVRRQMGKLFTDMVIDARRTTAAKTCRQDAKQGEAEEETLVDVLLGLQETAAGDKYYTDELIVGVIQVLFTAGIDTAWGTMEWAMSCLLNRPQTMDMLRAEIDAVVGHERLMETSDIPNLPFLNNVIKETLRLHPPGPLLLPHQSSAGCTVQGYDLPAGTMLLVNAYAIHRDPTVWTAPEEFKPERFDQVGCAGELGHTFIPFGSGRRKCPGEHLVLSFMSLALGSMIHCFDWRRAGEEEVDMAEANVSIRTKAEPLVACCRPRAAMLNVLITQL